MRRILALLPRHRIPMDTRPISVPSAQLALQPGDKRPRLESPRPPKRGKKKKHAPVESGSSEDVIFRDVVALLGKELLAKAEADGMEWESPFGFREEVELTVSSISSSGEGLALAPSSKGAWVVVVPFVLPGEVVRVRVYRHAKMHSFADLINVELPNPELRDMSRVQCKYFGACAGCQYQMLSYETQLDLKRNVVLKAYQNYSNLPKSSIPAIQPTIPSPLQYGYRTKITPHFDPPPKKVQKQGPSTSEEGKPSWLKIGFNQTGKRVVMDIEECPIATPVLNEAYAPMRDNIAKKIFTYKKGVSLLLRDSLEIPGGNSPTATTQLEAKDNHICITDHKATVRERVGDLLFDYQAGSFFQNNNSVLVPLTTYVRDAIFPPVPPSASASPPPTHLVDAYCGAGLFALTLAPHFTKVAGIELSADSIRFATHNAELNGLAHKVSFRAGDAAQIFGAVGDFPPERTALVVDPPRKGCDEAFVRQLLAFRAQTVVYVSCNVHTQARDIGQIVAWSAEEDTAEGKGKGKYVVESLRGFDLFPQTAHVESVAVLRLVS